MRRFAAAMSAVLVLGVGGTAGAHPLPAPVDCPCLILEGAGTKSTKVTLARAAVIQQNDVSTDKDGSRLSGWVVQDRQGTVVAARIFVADGPVYSHSVGSAPTVRLPAGVYTITRLSKTSHRFLIPIRGVPARRVLAAQRPALTGSYHLVTSAGPTVAGTMALPARALHLFAEARQNSSAHIQLVVCLDGSCQRRSHDSSDVANRRTPSVMLDVPVGSGVARTSTLATGLGVETSMLQVLLTATG